jgi:hypothetical protein
LHREKTLLIDETESLEKVQDFLNSKAINSKATKVSYGFALSHFQTFLSNSEYKDYNVETIIVSLLDRSIDVYILFKKFVEHLLNRQDPHIGNSKLSPRSIHAYVAVLDPILKPMTLKYQQTNSKEKLPYQGNINEV